MLVPVFVPVLVPVLLEKQPDPVQVWLVTTGVHPEGPQTVVGTTIVVGELLGVGFIVGGGGKVGELTVVGVDPGRVLIVTGVETVGGVFTLEVVGLDTTLNVGVGEGRGVGGV